MWRVRAALLLWVSMSPGDSLSDSQVLENITVRQGETVFLRCLQGDAVTRTAWLNRSSILYAGEDKWSVDPRVSLEVLSRGEFTIRIEDVDMYDEGQYVCAVQTRSRPRTTSVHVIVQVPPKITNVTKDMRVNEGSSIALMCSGSGRPEPSITWRILSPSARGIVSQEEYLEIPAVTRQQAGIYECSAVNEVSADVRTLQLVVNFPPSMSKGKDVGVPLGQRGVLQCEAEAEPAAEFEWYKDDRRIVSSLNGIEIENVSKFSRLTIFNVSEENYGNYTCVATNTLGSANTSIIVFGEYGIYALHN
uniref:Neurotrimin n=1 Tax=Scleropages formosus TaxID=113540 RepID=A0A8D0CF67_SCLFO